MAEFTLISADRNGIGSVINDNRDTFWEFMAIEIANAIETGVACTEENLWAEIFDKPADNLAQLFADFVDMARDTIAHDEDGMFTYTFDTCDYFSITENDAEVFIEGTLHTYYKIV